MGVGVKIDLWCFSFFEYEICLNPIRCLLFEEGFSPFSLNKHIIPIWVTYRGSSVDRIAFEIDKDTRWMSINRAAADRISEPTVLQ